MGSAGGFRRLSCGWSGFGSTGFGFFGGGGGSWATAPAPTEPDPSVQPVEAIKTALVRNTRHIARLTTINPLLGPIENGSRRRAIKGGEAKPMGSERIASAAEVSPR